MVKNNFEKIENTHYLYEELLVELLVELQYWPLLIALLYTLKLEDWYQRNIC